MQTFLPYKEFSRSAQCLDNKRLGKQRVEAYQILKTNYLVRKYPDKKFAWQNHPAVLMWRNYDVALVSYYSNIVWEWVSRGFKQSKGLLSVAEEFETNLSINFQFPPWLGNEDFHRSHRSNLVRKLPEHYKRFWPDIRDDIPYVWPVRKMV